MSIDEIKEIPITAYLEYINADCKKRSAASWWYRSPLHEEKTASFKVNTSENLWYDFGLNRGGNIINLIQLLHPEKTMHEILMYLSEVRRTGSFSENIPVTVPLHKQSVSTAAEATIIEQVRPIGHPYLKDYLQSRRISLQTGSLFCKEVHYCLMPSAKHYYAIGFRNMEGGYELRNKYCKRCLGKKAPSLLCPSPGGSYKSISWEEFMNGWCPASLNVVAFEGFFDFLSYMEIKRNLEQGFPVPADTDFLILNSVGLIGRGISIMGKYQTIHCCFDNDDAGRRTMERVRQAFDTRVIDDSVCYSDYNDINEMMMCRQIMD